jgi:hypothetical protein
MKSIPRPRLFDKRIQFWRTSEDPDGFGGATTTLSPTFTYVWAYVRKVSDVARANFVEAFGLTENEYVLRMTIRERTIEHRRDVVLYGNDFYRILVALPNDQYDVSIDLICVRIERPSISGGANEARLLENGDARLLENGDFRLLESA